MWCIHHLLLITALQILDILSKRFYKAKGRKS